MEKFNNSDSGNFGNVSIRPRRLFQNFASLYRLISTKSVLRWVHTTQDSFVWFGFKRSESKEQGSRTSDWSSVDKLTLVIRSPRHTFKPVKTTTHLSTIIVKKKKVQNVNLFEKSRSYNTVHITVFYYCLDQY